MRIGAVSYLNTKPLIYGLRERLPEAELVLDLPSRLADRLASRDLDIALIPSVEFLRGSDLAIVSDACIACRGPVRSVRVLFNVPVGEVATLALDEGSRTSAALAQVMLAERFGLRPQLVPLHMHEDYRDTSADAMVVIGDRAMQIDSSCYREDWDLGEQWTQQQSLPFVFAVWATHHRELPAELGFALTACRDAGLRQLDEIVAHEAPRYGLEPSDCYSYFAEQLYFRLEAPELAGLDLFRRQAVELELIPASSIELSLQPL